MHGYKKNQVFNVKWENDQCLQIIFSNRKYLPEAVKTNERIKVIRFKINI